MSKFHTAHILLLSLHLQLPFNSRFERKNLRIPEILILAVSLGTIHHRALYALAFNELHFLIMSGVHLVYILLRTSALNRRVVTGPVLFTCKNRGFHLTIFHQHFLFGFLSVEDMKCSMSLRLHLQFTVTFIFSEILKHMQQCGNLSRHDEALSTFNFRHGGGTG